MKSKDHQNGVKLNNRVIYILSVFDPTNYGNRLQACALESTVRSMTSKEVVSIDSRRPKRKSGLIKLAADLHRSLLDLKKISLARKKLFTKFQRDYCSRVIEIPENEICDIDGPVIIGSDQCWNPGWGIGACEFGAQCAFGVEKKMAYAASFGVNLEEILPSWRERYSIWLKSIDSIGVREFAGAEIVRVLSGQDAEVVLDPTMLMDVERWSQIERRPNIKGINGGFCLKYVLGVDGAATDIVNRCVREGLDLIDLTDSNLAVGPSEFVWLIHHSTLVCTDSFHATVFSLLFHKRFVIYEREGSAANMSSRFDTLNELFGINRNRSGLSCFDEDAVDNYDWTLFEQKLNIHRDHSLTWLNNSLERL